MPELPTGNGDPNPGTHSQMGFAIQSINFSSASEIQEEAEDQYVNEIVEDHPTPQTIREESGLRESSFDHQNGDDCIYVAVGKSNSSMDALLWTLKNVAKPSEFVYLVHVFPELRHIPTPLGKLPKNQVSAEQVESYLAQERGKRREFLQKFMDKCADSQVKVDTILIESDFVAKAVLELIPVLNIKRLVLGESKSSPRRLRRGNGTADEILKNAPDSCEVKIICEGKEVNDQMKMMRLPPPHADDIIKIKATGDDQINNSCGCFTRRFMR